MEHHDKIKDCYKSALKYPDLAKKLSQIGVTSSIVDVAGNASCTDSTVAKMF